MAHQSNEPLHRTWIHSEHFIPRRFIQPAQRFMQIEAASGVIMLVAAVAAVVWANSPIGESYHHFWTTPLQLAVGGFSLDLNLELFVNDALMALFFFMVGLEIKRELVVGELRDPKAAALPVLAALGGMLFPAVIYAVVAGTSGPEAMRGWGVPMATDIAFSLGVLSLLGKRVPTGAKLFLLALAIADDLGGILVIAFFYTEGLSLAWLGVTFAGLGLVALAKRAGIRSLGFYSPLAVLIWYCLFRSGVHATLAGVALAFLTPVRPMYGVAEFDFKARRILDTYPPVADSREERDHSDHEALLLAEIARESVAPLARSEHRLQKWVSFGIIPVFALANAGVRFEGGVAEALASRVALGVALGLVVGKALGISLFAWLAVRLKVGKLPAGASWRHMVGVAATGGVGFTVALFIAALAYRVPAIADEAKVGIFAGSILSGVIGATILAGAAQPAAADDTPPLAEPALAEA